MWRKIKRKMYPRFRRLTIVDVLGITLLSVSIYLSWLNYMNQYAETMTKFTNSETNSPHKNSLMAKNVNITSTVTKPNMINKLSRARIKTKKKRNLKGGKSKAIVCPSDSDPGSYDLTPLDVASNETKLILFWNPPSDWNGNFDMCECKNCKMTVDKCDFPRSYAVIFHAPNLGIRQIPRKIPGQVWILLNYEPPERSQVNLRKWKNKINWTWSYRRDSDMAFPYFEIKTKTTPQHRNFSGILKKKKKMAAWYVSHCKTESKREKYIKELQKYINIDIYGKCGPLKCPYDGARCYEMLNSVYAYYMGFENSHCTDYVTEKAFAYMAMDTVLVSRGGYLKDFFLPSHSFIDTSKFSSVHNLATYLKNLYRNTKEYEKYFRWKNHYDIVRKSNLGLCSICKRLHNLQKYYRVYNDIQTWTTSKNGEYICDKNPTDFIQH